MSIAFSWAAAVWLGFNGGVVPVAGVGAGTLSWAAAVWPATEAEKAPKKEVAISTTSNGANIFVISFFTYFFLLR